MSKRLDILGARIFGASVCHAPKYLQLFRKCPNVWTKSPDLAIMHKHKPYTSSTYTCICAFCYFINFLHTFLDIFNFTFSLLFFLPIFPFSSIIMILVHFGTCFFICRQFFHILLVPAILMFSFFDDFHDHFHTYALKR